MNDLISSRPLLVQFHTPFQTSKECSDIHNSRAEEKRTNDFSSEMLIYPGASTTGYAEGHWPSLNETDLWVKILAEIKDTILKNW
jgi:hypothetical protein